ncbi:MAG: YdcF family protein [Gammaproteobacteria bacterium]|nr:YdcF family protein [Gammaproteobacteria bacterium]
MGQEIVWAIKPLLLPPGGILLLGLLALLARRRLRQLLLICAFVALYLSSTPFVAGLLMRQVEIYPALAESEISAGNAAAIVVLGGGRRSDAPEYGGDTVNSSLLERVRYAAYLAARTGLPVIPSGGQRMPGQLPEALLAEKVLTEEFRVPVAVAETRSRTTWENALFTAELLRDRGIGRVYLVTHAMHMPRSVEVFRRAGIQVIPAPTVFHHRDKDRYWLSDWLPKAKALRLSNQALHELLGNLWYALRQWWQEMLPE